MAAVTPELTPEEVRRSTVQGVGLMAARTLLLRVIGVVAATLLARWLSPEHFGVFTVCTAITGALGILSDMGLRIVLTQQEKRPPEEELRLTFTVQTGLAGLFVLGLGVSASWVATAYHWEPGGSNLLLFAALAMLPPVLGSIPSVLTDRGLLFARRAMADVAQQGVYYTVALALAARGGGVWSLLVGVLAGCVAENLVLYRGQPWRPRFSWETDRARKLLRRGLPVQFQALLTIAEDSVVALGMGLACGPVALGYLVWARSLSLVPHLAAFSLYGRLVLPSLSRLQADPPRFADSLDRAVAAIAFLVLPCLAVLGAVAHELVPLVFTPKWVPALPVLYWLVGVAALTSLTTPYYLALLALGRAPEACRARGLLVAMLWLGAAPAGWLLGVETYAAAACLAYALGMVITLRALRGIVPVRAGRALLAPLASTLALLAYLLLVGRALPPGPAALGVALGSGATVYAAAVLLTVRGGLAILDPFGLACRIVRLNLPRALPV